jgi:hypothetical protein
MRRQTRKRRADGALTATGRMVVMKSIKSLLVPLLVAGLLVGCGGRGAEDDPAGAVLDPDGQGEVELPEDQTFPIGQTFWHAGFQVDVEQAVLSAEADNFTNRVVYLLTLDSRFTNLGPREVSFSSPTAVVAGGESYPSARVFDRPVVPGGLTGSGALVYEVDETFDITSAHLLAGENGQNQARVPLGPQGGELVDHAPEEHPMSNTAASVELLDLVINSVGLRADVPVNYAAVAQGKLAMTLHLTATSRKSGRWNLMPQDLALILPDGTAVGVDGSELGSLRGSDSGIDTTGLYARFIVSDPPTGEYTLRVSLPTYWVPADGDNEGLATFTIR